MRYEVYDEQNKLFDRFWDRQEAQRVVQPGWKLVTKTKFFSVFFTPTTLDKKQSTGETYAPHCYH